MSNLRKIRSRRKKKEQDKLKVIGFLQFITVLLQLITIVYLLITFILQLYIIFFK